MSKKSNINTSDRIYRRYSYTNSSKQERVVENQYVPSFTFDKPSRYMFFLNKKQNFEKIQKTHFDTHDLQFRSWWWRKVMFVGKTIKLHIH